MLEIATKKQAGIGSVSCIGHDSSARNPVQNLLVAESFTLHHAKLVPEGGIIGVFATFFNNKLSVGMKNKNRSKD